MKLNHEVSLALYVHKLCRTVQFETFLNLCRRWWTSTRATNGSSTVSWIMNLFLLILVLYSCSSSAGKPTSYFLQILLLCSCSSSGQLEHEPLWGRLVIKLSHFLLGVSSAVNILIYSYKVSQIKSKLTQHPSLHADISNTLWHNFIT